MAASRGVLHVLSCPAALCPHVEWAVAGVLGAPVNLTWSPQPVAPGTLRSELAWSGRPGAGGALASATKSWPMLRYEVTEEPGPGFDGERYSYTPALGLLRVTTSANGDVLVGEDRLRAAVAGTGDGQALAHTIESLLGAPWDAELEPYRSGVEAASVRWLYEVG